MPTGVADPMSSTRTLDYGEITWWHQVPLRDGRVTPGQSPTSRLEPFYLFDRIDFVGRSVLDIGCWDGYFSFMAEQRGASRVIAVDDPAFRCWGMDGFDYLHAHFASSVEFRRGSVSDLPINESFDIVLCYGVLYHVSDPLRAALNCFRAATSMVAFESVLVDNEQGCLILLDPGELNGDRSNVFVPTTGFVDKVAAQCGFARVAACHDGPQPGRGALLYERTGEPVESYPTSCFD